MKILKCLLNYHLIKVNLLFSLLINIYKVLSLKLNGINKDKREIVSLNIYHIKTVTLFLRLTKNKIISYKMKRRK